MRGKRAKQYRKLMHQYHLTFSFREPYQVLIDAAMIRDAARFKMDLLAGLERTLQGKIKPMITHCSIRHLRAASSSDNKNNDELMTVARQCEMRRCGHHELPEPLSTLDCLSEVVDPKRSGTNKHRYVVASQDRDVRARMQRIPGVPLVYIKRSVMIMEPMSEATEAVIEREERGKFRAGLKGRRDVGVLAGRGEKRKREEAEDDDDAEAEVQAGGEGQGRRVDGGAAGADAQAAPAAKKRRKGPKGPNPLSVKKPKKRPAQDGTRVTKKPASESAPRAVTTAVATPVIEATTTEEPTKKKRKRRHKSNTDSANADARSANRRGTSV